MTRLQLFQHAAYWSYFPWQQLDIYLDARIAPGVHSLIELPGLAHMCTRAKNGTIFAALQCFDMDCNVNLVSTEDQLKPEHPHRF